MKFNHLQKTAAAAGLILLLLAVSACKSMTGEDSGKKKAEKNGLTAEQLAKMSPEDLHNYLESQEKKKKAASFSESMEAMQRRKSEHKRKLMDTSRQMTPEEKGSVFPWRSSPGNRSEQLHDSMIFDR